MRRLYTHAARMTTLLILLQYEFETKKILFLVADFEEGNDSGTSIWRTIFFTPVTVKYMKKNMDITKPLYREQILPVPWHFVIIEVPLYYFLSQMSGSMGWAKNAVLSFPC